MQTRSEEEAMEPIHVTFVGSLVHGEHILIERIHTSFHPNVSFQEQLLVTEVLQVQSCLLHILIR